MDLKKYIRGITPPESKYERKMEKYIDGLTKPVGSLGKLEDIVIRLAGIQGTMAIETSPKVSIIMCADNGVCDQGVSSCPQEVTAIVTTNFTRGITAMNKLSSFVGAKMHVVDIGVKEELAIEGVQHRKVMKGTHDMTQGMAIGHEKVYEAIQVGIEETTKLIEEGYQIFGTGEMGIGV